MASAAAAAMVGVANGDRERIRLVSASEPRLREQEPDHRLDPLLLRVPRAHDRLLDQVRRVLGNPKPPHGGRQQSDAARLPKLEGRPRVLVHKSLFHGRLARLGCGNHGHKPFEQLTQAVGKILVRRRGNNARRDIAQPHAIGLDDAPSGAP